MSDLYIPTDDVLEKTLSKVKSQSTFQGLTVQPWEYELITKSMATAENPEEDGWKWANAIQYSRLFDKPVSETMQNLEAYNQAFLGQATAPKTAAKAIVDSVAIGILSQKMNAAGNRYMMSGGTDESALAEYDELSEQTNSLADNVENRWLTTEALKAGMQSLPYMIESSIPGAIAAGAGAVLSGGTLSGVAIAALYKFGSATGSAVGVSGTEYMRMRKNGVDHDTAASLAVLSGAAQGAIEVALGADAAVASILSKGAVGTISGNVAQKIVTKGLWPTIAARFGTRIAGQMFEEGIEEALQEVVSSTADYVAAEIMQEKGVEIDRDSFEQVLSNVWESAKMGALAAPVFGIALGPLQVNADYKALKGMAEFAKSTDKDTFKKEALKSEAIQDILSGVPEEKRDEALTQVWKNAQAEVRAESQKKATGKDSVERVDGGLYTAEETVREREDGTVDAIMKVGSPKSGERYGYLRYEIQPTEDGTRQILLKEANEKEGYEVGSELLVELSAKYPGVTIVTSEASSERAVMLVEQASEANPRGSEYGAQWFDGEDNSVDSKARAQMRSDIVTNMPSMTPGHVEVALSLHEARASALKIGFADYRKKYFQDEMFSRDSAKLQSEFDQAKLTGQVDGKKARAGISFDADSKALIYVTQNSDFNSFVHESGHAWRKQTAGTELGKQLDSLYGVVAGVWEREQEEQFVSDLQSWMTYGKVRDEGLRGIFEQIGRWLSKLLGSLTGKIQVSPEIESALNDLFSSEKSPMSQMQGQDEVAQAQGIEVEQEPEDMAVEAKEYEVPEVAATVKLSETPSGEVLLSEISLSEDVPNFKEGANSETGAVEPIKAGKYERLGTAPIVLWERLNGNKEVITGRHRLDLARRLGEVSIPAQIVKESDGFTKAQAATFDAEANIRDGQGSVKDYANYFRNSEITSEEASSRGLLSRDKGRAGFNIGKYATDNLYSLYRAGQIGDKKASIIAEIAPGDEKLQALGVSKARALKVDELASFMSIMKASSSASSDTTGNLFGIDDSMIIEAEKIAKEASKITDGLIAEQTALKGALKLGKADRESILKQYGFKAGDKKSIEARLASIENELNDWANWTTSSDKIRELRVLAGLPVSEILDTVEEQAFVDTDTPMMFQSERAVENVISHFPSALKGFSDIHSQSQITGILNSFGRGVVDPKTGEVRIGTIGTSHVGLATGISDAKRFYYGYSKDRKEIYVVSKNGMDDSYFKKPEILKVILSQVFDKFRLSIAEGKKLGFQDTSKILFQADSLFDESTFNEKAVQEYGVTNNANEAGYILSDGRMLDFSGRVSLTKGTTAEVKGGTRLLNHDAIATLEGLTKKNPVIDFMKKTGAIKIDLQAGVAYSIGIPSFDSAAILSAHAKGDFTLHIDGENGELIGRKHFGNIQPIDVATFYDKPVKPNTGSLFGDDEPNVKVSKGGQTLLFQSGNDTQWIYKAEEVAKAKLQGPMPGKNILSMFRSAGVKEEELLWTGLDEFLDTDEKIKPADLQEYLDQNKVKIEEVSKVSNPERRISDPTHYSRYVIPGGENYTELLLTLPKVLTSRQVEIDNEIQSIKADINSLLWPEPFVHLKERTDDGKAVTLLNAKMDSLKKEYEKIGLDNPGYYSAHWRESNVVSHARYDERTLADGRRMFFIEEIQSDWHQAGRSKGYLQKWPDTIAEMTVQQLKDFIVTDDQRADVDGLSREDLLGAIKEMGLTDENIRDSYGKPFSEGIPDAPFKKTWPEMTFRRMLRAAVEGGFDVVGWTTGEQQADRYSLAKSIGRLEYDISDNTLTAWNTDMSTTVIQDTYNPEELPDVIGKEAAEKLLSSPHDDEGVHALSGLDLKVGGEGMKGFYDKMIVDYANKYAKKWGAKASSETLTTGEEVHSLPITDQMKVSVNQGQMLFQTDNGSLVVLHNIDSDRLDSIEDFGGLPMPSLAVTRPDIDFTQFGDSTLIADPSIARAAMDSNELYDRDIWSPTVPKPEWKVNNKFLNKWNEKWLAAGKIVGEYVGLQSLMESDIKGGAARLAANIHRYHATMYMYLAEKGTPVEPVYTTMTPDWNVPLEIGLAVKKYIDANQEYSEDYESEHYNKLQKIVKSATLNYYKEAKVAGLVKRLQERFSSGNIFYSIVKFAREYDESKKVIDKDATHKALLAAIEPQEEEYMDWLKESLSGGYSNPTIKVSGSKVPFNAASVLDWMRSQNTRASQETMTYGPAKAASMAGASFGSREELRDKEGTLVSSEESARIYEETIEPLAEELQEKLPQYYRYSDTWEALDGIYKAVGNYLYGGTKKPSPERMRKALSSQSFVKVPSELVDTAVEMAHNMADKAQDYFEAKPGMILKLQDFKAAVVPAGIKESTKSMLVANGLKLYEYGDKENRSDIVRAAISELPGVLFQSESDAVRNEIEARGLDYSIRYSKSTSSKYYTFNASDRAYTIRVSDHDSAQNTGMYTFSDYAINVQKPGDIAGLSYWLDSKVGEKHFIGKTLFDKDVASYGGKDFVSDAKKNSKQLQFDFDNAEKSGIVGSYEADKVTKEQFDSASKDLDKGISEDIEAGFDARRGSGKAVWSAYKQLKEVGTTAILGAEIDINETGFVTDVGWRQLVGALQVYRNRKYETFRYVVIDNSGKIIKHIAVSSRMPSVTGIFPSNSDPTDYMKELFDYVEANNSKLVIVHNHPSGNVEASIPDIDVTDRIQDYFGKYFGGHIILDHGKYGLQAGQSQSFKTVEFDNDGIDETLNPDTKFEDIKVLGPKELLSLAQLVDKDSETVAMFFLSTQGKVTALEYFDKTDFSNGFACKQKIQKSGLEYGAINVLAIYNGDNRQTALDIKEVVFSQHVILDASINGLILSENRVYGGQIFQGMENATTQEVEESRDISKDNLVNAISLPEAIYDVSPEYDLLFQEDDDALDGGTFTSNRGKFSAMITEEGKLEEFLQGIWDRMKSDYDPGNESTGKSTVETQLSSHPFVLGAAITLGRNGQELQPSVRKAVIGSIRKNELAFKTMYAEIMKDEDLEQEARAELESVSEMVEIKSPKLAGYESMTIAERTAIIDTIRDKAVKKKIETDAITDAEIVEYIGRLESEAAKTGKIDKLKGKNAAMGDALKSAREEASKQTRFAASEVRAMYRLREARETLIKRILTPPTKNMIYSYKTKIRFIQEYLKNKKWEIERTENGGYRKTGNIVEPAVLKMQFSKLFKETPELGNLLTANMINKINELPISAWSVSDLKAIYASIQALWKQGTYEYAVKRTNRINANKEMIRKINDSVRNLPGFKESDTYGTVEEQDQVRKLGNKYLLLLTTANMDRLAERFDGKNPDKLNWNLLIQEERDHRNKKYSQMERRVKPIYEYMKSEKYKPKDLYRKITVPGAGVGAKTATYTASDLMMIMLALRNDKSRAAFVYGNLLNPQERKTFEGDILKEMVKPRLAAIMGAIENDLSQTEKALAEMIGADFDKEFDRLNEVVIDLTEEELRKESNYIPIKRVGEYFEQFSDEIISDLFARNGISPKAGPKKGMTKERINIGIKNQTPMRLDLFGSFLDAVDKQEHLIEYSAYHKRLVSVYASKGSLVTDAIKHTFGKQGVDKLNEYIAEVANPIQYKDRDYSEKLVKMLRGNMAVGYLAYRWSSAANQLVTSPMPYIAYAPGQLVIQAAKAVLNPIKYVQEAEALSIYLRNRSIDPMYENIKHMGSEGWQGVVKAVGTTGMKGLEWVDRYSVAMGWMAVYQKELDKTGDAKAAERKADNVTARCQPSASGVDLSPLFRDNNEWKRVLTQFGSQLNVVWQQVAFDLPKAVADKQFCEAIGISVAMVLAGLGMGAIRQIRGKDEPEEEGDVWKQWLSYGLSQGPESVPLVGKLVVGFVDHMITGKVQYKGNDIFPMFGGMLDGVQGIMDGAMDGEIKGRHIADLAESIGLSLGMPTLAVEEYLGWMIERLGE